MSKDIKDLADRYVGLWNEPDAQVRRKAIEELWAQDGTNYTESVAAIGYDALEARITRAYETYVGSGTYRFRAAEIPVSHHHQAVKIDWEMIRAIDGTIATTGQEFLILDQDGKIMSDHQFLLS